MPSEVERLREAAKAYRRNIKQKTTLLIQQSERNRKDKERIERLRAALLACKRNNHTARCYAVKDYCICDCAPHNRWIDKVLGE